MRVEGLCGCLHAWLCLVISKSSKTVGQSQHRKATRAEWTLNLSILLRTNLSIHGTHICTIPLWNNAKTVHSWREIALSINVGILNWVVEGLYFSYTYSRPPGNYSCEIKSSRQPSNGLVNTIIGLTHTSPVCVNTSVTWSLHQSCLSRLLRLLVVNMEDNNLSANTLDVQTVC